jgi:threonyl-tRNA synthetase
VRITVERADENVNARIRRSKLEKVPYILVVGDDDVSSSTVGVNARGSEGAERGVDLDGFTAQLVAQIAHRGSPESESSASA